MITVIDAKIADWQNAPLNSGRTGIWWLGRAGFLLRSGARALVIDPYLSDSLEKKYREKKFKHDRLMPVPVQPCELTVIDWVFSSHSHTDHQ